MTFSPITVSAPAKLFLLGEHAVVFDGTCIVTAVDARLYVTLTQLTEPVIRIDAPDVGLVNWQRSLNDVLVGPPASPESAFIESSLRVFHEIYPISSGVHIQTHSEFKRDYGIGSSSAVVAAMLFGLAHLYEHDMSHHQLLEMGVDAIQRVQNLGSGADLAAAIYGRTVYYVNREPRRVEPIALDELPLLVVYSGHKASTKNWVEAVGNLQQRWPTIITPIIDTMLSVVEAGKIALETHNWPQLGELMNMQHGLLHSLGVDTAALSHIVFIARQHDAWGAKLSGAGGGDCAIVLCAQERLAEVRQHLEQAGFEILDMAVHAPGVRRESR